MIRYRYSKYYGWFCLFLVLLITLVQPIAVFADVMTPSNAFAVNPDYLIGSASNANLYSIATMELSDEDYGIAPLSSIGTVENTLTDCLVEVMYTNGTFVNSAIIRPQKLNNRFDFSFTMPDFMDGYWVSHVFFYFSNKYEDFSALPPPGNYMLSFDMASDFSFSKSAMWLDLHSVYPVENAETEVVSTVLSDVIVSSGDLYLAPFAVNFRSGYNDLRFRIGFNIKDIENFGGDFAICLERTSETGIPTAGGSVTSQDYENGVSSSLSDISSSIGDMSSSLDSAAENLEYISTSQNLIIQGIDNVIMHISDQLYAFWDQLYNLIHEPTYARLGDILDALKAIANNSDIYAVVETIEESSEKQTADIIANNNANTTKVESAVEKHGNFIIDGLKGLFIPSDEYFKTYFDDLYSYFSDRFGFLSFPIDLLVRLIDLFANSSDRDCILTLPSFEISGEQLISEASFNLTEFLENDFSLVLSSIRMVTSIGLIMAFVSLCQTKWNEVMRN